VAPEPSGSGSAGDALDLGSSGGYPGDSASEQQVAAWMGSAAQKRGLPSELPVMASLVESGMKNLNYGDADSVGFFQMRLSVWNQGGYSGYSSDPEKQLDWFLDQAVKVKQQRLAAGEPVDPAHYGDWVADIERPAAQYRGRYELRLGQARSLLQQAQGNQHPAAAELVNAVPGGAPAAAPEAMLAVNEAKQELGVPYVWGGSSPKTGFDCSGLVQWAYAKVGIRLPRTSEQQILAPGGTPVDRSHLLPGDLVFFRNSAGDVHHVGISLGGDKFINAPQTGENVREASLKEPYFAQEFAGGRRFVKATSGAVQARAASGAVAQQPPAIDPRAVHLARQALERDAAEVVRPGTALHQALQRQELGKGNQVQFLKAADVLRASRRRQG
jgi:cell wall-associated NlpC family hydrolase